MTWLKKDDKYPEHRKIRRLSDGAYRLHDTALCWAAKDETDGLILATDITEMQHGKRLGRYVQELIDAGLWELTSGGWQLHDFDHYNPTHVQLEAERAASRERQARARAKRRGVNDSSDSHAVTNGVTNGVSHAPVTRESQPPVPYRSVPTRTVPVILSNPDGSDPTEYTADFLTFWAIYPRREKKRPALASWKRAKKRATPAAITVGAACYRDDPNREKAFTKLPTTWLDGDCWDDDPLPERPDTMSRQGSFFKSEMARLNAKEPATVHNLHQIGAGA